MPRPSYALPRGCHEKDLSRDRSGVSRDRGGHARTSLTGSKDCVLGGQATTATKTSRAVPRRSERPSISSSWLARSAPNATTRGWGSRLPCSHRGCAGRCSCPVARGALVGGDWMTTAGPTRLADAQPSSARFLEVATETTEVAAQASDLCRVCDHRGFDACKPLAEALLPRAVRQRSSRRGGVPDRSVGVPSSRGSWRRSATRRGTRWSRAARGPATRFASLIPKREEAAGSPIASTTSGWRLPVRSCPFNGPPCVSSSKRFERHWLGIHGAQASHAVATMSRVARADRSPRAGAPRARCRRSSRRPELLPVFGTGCNSHLRRYSPSPPSSLSAFVQARSADPFLKTSVGSRYYGRGRRFVLLGVRSNCSSISSDRR